MQKEQEVRAVVNRTGNLTLLGPVNNRVDFNGWTPNEKINGKKLYVCNTQHESGSPPVSVLPDNGLCSICDRELEQQKQVSKILIIIFGLQKFCP